MISVLLSQLILQDMKLIVLSFISSTLEFNSTTVSDNITDTMNMMMKEINNNECKYWNIWTKMYKCKHCSTEYWYKMSAINNKDFKLLN